MTTDFLSTTEPSKEQYLFRCPTCKRELALLPAGYKFADKIHVTVLCVECVERDIRYTAVLKPKKKRRKA